MGKCQPQLAISSFESSLWLPADFVNDRRRQRGGALLFRSAWEGRSEVVKRQEPSALQSDDTNANHWHTGL